MELRKHFVSKTLKIKANFEARRARRINGPLCFDLNKQRVQISSTDFEAGGFNLSIVFSLFMHNIKLRGKISGQRNLKTSNALPRH